MKALPIILLIFLSSIFSINGIKKDSLPPGTITISENLFADKTEVRNIDWKEFMFWMKRIYGENSEEYISTLPDTLVWAFEPFQKYYFQHPAYAEYPVVGVSYEQVIKYCKWRSDRVNELIYIKENRLKIDTGKTFTDFPEIYKYRLPSKVEWEKLAMVGFTEHVKKKMNKHLHTKNIYNFKKEESPVKDTLSLGEFKNINGPISVNAFWPNKFGLYNILGNVAEMTDIKGIAKGGSWVHNKTEFSIQKDYTYNNPTNWLGFRCVCEKVKF